LIIPRHRTALSRTTLSRPFQLVFEDQLVDEEVTFFDFGCGQGGDLQQLTKSGYDCNGWDPVFRTDGDKIPAKIVNLGYVVNVIEKPDEREKVLKEAWSLTQDILIVSARLNTELRNKEFRSYRDGYITKLGTFQKFYEQSELKEWLEQQLKQKPVPAGPGIFYIFRDETKRQSFIANRFHRRIARPRIRKSDLLFEKYRDRFEKIIGFFTERGRLPRGHELLLDDEFREEVGTNKQAFWIVKKITGEKQWAKITEERANDLLVYIALSKFDGLPKMSKLAQEVQYDIKTLFGFYREACKQADELLFTLGEKNALNDICLMSPIGKLTPKALYIHESALSEAGPLVRLYEGCGRAFIGRVEGGNIIKLHRDKPKVSYLTYPNFEKDPHPALERAVVANLETISVHAHDYSQRLNKPILHRKELFISPNNKNFKKYSKLTAQEEKAGLFEDVQRIGTKKIWDETLFIKNVKLKGHQLIQIKN
jgi:DNA phosphorothioation-associated putative methyltransferase